MKKVFAILIILISSLIFAKVGFAQEIIVGEISAKAEVHNIVEGNGNVQTNIEVEANGIKKLLHATGSGEYKLEVKSPPETINNIQVTPTITPTITPTVEKKSAEVKQNETFIVKVQNVFKDFFQKLKNLFKTSGAS